MLFTRKFLEALGCKEIKQLFGITDLEETGSRNLGNTGITMYVANNQYYIKK